MAPPARVPLLALGLVVAAAAATMGRVFVDGEWAPSIVGAVVLPVLLAVGGASARQSGLRVLLVSVLLAVAYAGWAVAPDTTTFGLPGRATLERLGDLFSSGVDLIGDERAPVVMDPGRQLLAIWGVWACAALALWLASDVGGVLSPLAPPFAVVVFTAVCDKHRTHLLGPGFFVGACAAYLVLSSRPVTTARVWCVSPRRPPGPVRLAMLALPVGLAVALLAPQVGQRLPGAGADELVTWRTSGSGGSGRRVTISPLVSLQARLTQQPVETVFTVQPGPGEQASRWRLMALEEFDGDIWRSNSSTDDASEVLPRPDEVATQPGDLHLRFTIVNLHQTWVPAAYKPIAVDHADLDLITETQTLLVGGDLESSDGLTYEVVARPPAATPDQLRAAPTASSSMDEYRELPPGIDPRVQALAQRITATAATPYDQALALQNYLRLDGGYIYDQDIPRGQDLDALTTFLFDTRTGYCEQFAGSFGVLARMVGLPTRVAVGFTPGSFDATTGLYTVTTEQAHAWPEVYFEGFGWLAFEPTPGRASPTADHTGTQGDAADTGAQATAPTTTPTTTAGSTVPGGVPIGEALPEEGLGAGGTATARDEGDGGPPWVLLAGLAVVVVAVGGAAGIAGAKAARRRRRRSGEPGDAVAGAWDEALDRLVEVGAPARPTETALEVAESVGSAIHTRAGEAMGKLALLRTTTAWSADPTRPDDAVAAWAAYTDLERALAVGTSARERWRRRFDVRPLLPRAEATPPLTVVAHPDDSRHPLGV